MMRSMFSGVSGLRNHQIRMDALGNNIANVNTVGYKGSRVSFQDTLNQTLRGASAPNGNRGGINAVQVGLGMNLASIDVFQTQGNLQNTGKITDMAIQGDGFFVLSDGSRQYYTRAGNFNIERDGRLTNPSNGLVVEGWMADISGVLNTNMPIGQIRLPLGQTIAPVATTTVEFGGNLASDTNCRLDDFSMTVSDSNNKTCTIQFKFTKTGFNTYDFKATVPPELGSISGPPGSGTGFINMNENGVVINATTGGFTVTPIGGDPIYVEYPFNNTPNSGHFVAHATGTDQFFTFAGFTGTAPIPTYNSIVYDEANNPCNIEYTITNIGGDHYTWSVNPENPPNNCTIESGNTGTFDYDPATGVHNVSPGNTVVKSTAASAVNIVINPPVERAGVPHFPVAQRVPEVPTAPNFTIPVAAYNIGDTVQVSRDVTNSNGEIITTLNYNLTCTDDTAAPDYDFDFTLTAADGTITGGTGAGSFTWDSTTGDITASTAGTTKFHLRSNIELYVQDPPISAVPVTIGLLASGGQESATKFILPQPVVTVTKVYDSLGSAHNLTTTSIKVANNNWTWETLDENGNSIGQGTLTFNSETGYISYSGGPITFTPIGANPISITPDFSNLTQGAGIQMDDNGMPISELTSPYQDGYPLGQLQAFNVDKSGRIIGVFSNGMNQNLAQLAMAIFTNPAGLSRSGDTIFEESSNSGSAQIGQAGMSGRGLVSPGAIEMSNVDLSQEFTDMIVTQRGFQANSRIITTTDEMLQELVNLKR